MRSLLRSILVLCMCYLGFVPAARAEDSPFSGKTLADRMRLEKTVLCTDGKSHYVAVVPHETQVVQLFYGDGKTFHRVPPPPQLLPGHLFSDPRYFDKSMNRDFRGSDLRYYSSVDTEGGKCEVRCGERKTKLTVVEADKKKALLSGAAFEPPVRKREPYALARDQEGTYYYVDHGVTQETAKNFRLFVGPKGSLKLQKMTDVVSDSEGEIFATKTGSLRMILGKLELFWIANKRTKKLLRVPIEENQQMIYNDFGIYTGEKLGTPCDDL